MTSDAVTEKVVTTPVPQSAPAPAPATVSPETVPAAVQATVSPEAVPAAAPAPTPSSAATPAQATESVVAPAIGIRSVKIKNPASTTPGKRGRKSMKEIASRIDLVKVPEDEELFKKQYYSIGEVAQMFSEKQSLIRYWESEFDILQPRKNRKGDRFFRPVDVKNLVLIYDLLRRRKFTIDGARDFLKKNKKADERFALIQSLQKLRGFLQELRSNL